MKAPDLLTLALHWLRRQYPGAVLIPELCVGHWGAASMDVGAVLDDEIIGVEIKGDGDSPTRLDRQGIAYGMVADRMWLLPSPDLEARCWKKTPSGWGRLVVRDRAVAVYCGEVREPRQVDPTDTSRWPAMHHVVVGEDLYTGPVSKLPSWRAPTRSAHASAATMAGVLWADELRDLQSIHADTFLKGKRLGRNGCDILPLISEHVPVSVIRPFLCRTLRERAWEDKRKTVYRPGDALPELPAYERETA